MKAVVFLSCISILRYIFTFHSKNPTAVQGSILQNFHFETFFGQIYKAFRANLQKIVPAENFSDTFTKHRSGRKLFGQISSP
jgi:hypothetical protein